MDEDLASIARALDAFDHILAAWDTLTESARQRYRTRWRAAMRLLERMGERFRRDELPMEQRHRYSALVDRVLVVRESVERLGFHFPDVR